MDFIRVAADYSRMALLAKHELTSMLALQAVAPTGPRKEFAFATRASHNGYVFGAARLLPDAHKNLLVRPSVAPTMEG